jgi:hypothetical protein
VLVCCGGRNTLLLSFVLLHAKLISGFKCNEIVRNHDKTTEDGSLRNKTTE